MSALIDLWSSKKERDWRIALDQYWSFVRPVNLGLERELNDLKIESIEALDAIRWYDFLRDKYFRWKYTAPNRYATTSMALKKYKDSNQLDRLFDIKKRLLAFNTSEVLTGLSIASEIRGLGVAGASGLLSLMFPNIFGTVDQFIVKALWQLPELSENSDLKRMKPESLTLRDGVILIDIMQRKANENNQLFSTDFWTPRKIDMILWASR